MGWAHRDQGDFLLSNRRRFELLAGRLSSMAVNCSKAFSESQKYRRSSKTLSASRHAVSSMKSDRLRPSASAARSINAFCFRLARKLIVSLCRSVSFPAPPLATAFLRLLQNSFELLL